jgi:hypothetical protein
MVLDIGREKDHMEEVEKIINAVADAADLRPCQIICRRRYPETIDARWIAVKMLHDEGFYSSRIASIMGMTPRNVNRILYKVEIGLSMGEKHLGNILERARKYLLK